MMRHLPDTRGFVSWVGRGVLHLQMRQHVIIAIESRFQWLNQDSQAGACFTCFLAQGCQWDADIFWDPTPLHSIPVQALCHGGALCQHCRLQSSSDYGS